MKGEVIGINSNKIGGSAVEGMGYAIPISAAKPIIEDLMLRETSSEDLLRVMEYYSVGDTVQVTVMQGSPEGWESKEVTVTLGRRTE